jgi:CRP-like cAMP-binding protein
MTTVKDLRDMGEKRIAEGDALGAIKIFRLVLEAAPLDFDTRLRIADLLLELGERKLAAAIYMKSAVYDIKAGVPLRAVVAIKMLAKAAPEVKGFIHDLATVYCADSPIIGRGARVAPVDLSGQCRDDLDLDYEMDEAELKRTTAQMAAYTDDITQFPPRVPPVPLFSRLDEAAFERVVSSLELKRLGDGEVVVREGDPGDSFFVIARGTVRVFRRAAKSGARVDLARLGEGSVLGEMALVSSQPRTASVDVEGGADLLVFNREALAALADALPQVAEVLDRYAQERMIKNVLATNPLFQPFERKQSLALLERFEAHKIGAGTLVVRQGEEGRGLYIVLAGAVEVMKEEEGKTIKLKTLGPGETFGEISLVQDRPTTATVQAERDSTILFLPCEYFQKVLDAVPELAEYFLDLGVQRMLETRRTVEKATEEEQVEIVLDDSMIVL